MKKTLAIFAMAALATGFMGCDNAAEQEKLKTDISKVESSSTALDSTLGAVQQTSQELDELLNELKAE